MPKQPALARDKVFWAILLASAAVKAGLACVLIPWAVADERAYLHLARTLLTEGDFEGTFRPPLYPAFMATILAAGGGKLGIRLVQVLLSTLTLIPVFRIARRSLGLSPARVAVGLVAFDPVLIMFSNRLWSETLFILLLLVAFDLLSADSAIRRSWVWVLAGVLLGLGGLTRSMIVTFVPLLLPWAVLRFRRVEKPQTGTTAPPNALRTGMFRFTLLALGCAAVVLPWTIRNWRTSGALIIVDSNGPYNLLVGNRPEAAFVDKDDYWSIRYCELAGEDYRKTIVEDAAGTQQLALQRAWEYIQDDPGRFIRKSAWEAGHFWTLDSFLLRHLRNHWYGRGQPTWLTPTLTLVSAGFFAVLVTAGALGLASQPPAPFRGLTILLVVHSTLLFAVTYSLSRYCLPLHALLAIPAAGFLTHPREAVSRLVSYGWLSARNVVLLLVAAGLILAWARDLPMMRDMVVNDGASHRFHFDWARPGR